MIYREKYFSAIKKEILSFVTTWMNLNVDAICSYLYMESKKGKLLEYRAEYWLPGAKE